MSIAPSATAKQKAQEMLKILRGITIVDINDAIEMVQYRVTEFSDHQAFGPLRPQADSLGGSSLKAG